MLATHASAFRVAAEKLLPGSGIYTPAPGTRLFRTLTSNAGARTHFQAKPMPDFTGCNIQKTP